MTVPWIRTAVTLAVLMHAGCMTPPAAPAPQEPAKPAATASPAASPRIVVRALDAADWEGRSSAALQAAPGEAVRLAAAGRETVGFVVRIDCNSDSACALQVRSSSAGQSQVQVDIFHCQFVELEQPPGWQIKSAGPERRTRKVPDVLVPAGAGTSFSARAGQPVLLWIDVQVLASARPGRHDLALEVFDGPDRLARVPIELSVRHFALPENPGTILLAPLELRRLLAHHLRYEGQPHLPENILEGDPLQRQATRLLHETIRLLQQHGLSPFVQGLHPLKRYAVGDSAEVVIDWEDYDRLVERLLAGDLYPGQPAVPLWPLPFDEVFPPPPPYDALDSPTYARELRQYLTLCEDHFAAKGWLDRAFLMLPAARPDDMQGKERMRLYSEIARRATNRVPLVAVVPPQDLRAYGWEDYPFVDMRDLADVWCPPAQFYDPAVFEQADFRNQRHWLGLDRPPFSGSVEICARPTDTRVIPWQARRLAAQAVLLPVIDGWSDEFDESELTAHFRGDQAPLLVPGRTFGLDAPVPTLRLKMLRRGLQDLAYLTLCREQNQLAAADVVAAALCAKAGAEACGAHFADGRFDAWEQDARVWNQAVGLLGDLLEQLATTDDPPANPLASPAWQSFLSATQRIDVVPAGAALRRRPLSASPDVAEQEALMMIRVVNRTAQSARCQLKLDPLPLGWTAVEAAGLSVDLGPYDQRLVSLGAQTSAVTTGPDGRVLIPVQLSCPGQDLLVRSIPVAHLTAQRTARAPQIDGDPADWPVGVGNTATGLLAVSAAADEPAAARNPGQDVRAFATCDRENLYFIIHAFTPGNPGRSAALRSFVTYDDGIPAGEDLVEILIDPTNGRSSSPGDLYHIAIKPTGVFVAERGVRMEPQVGAATPWLQHIEVAISTLNDRWIAEVKVPLHDFGPLADIKETWAIDFTRFSPALQTYSTWSGARWNAYNPASLGNMTFGE
jgi:hypothetical protein